MTTACIINDYVNDRRTYLLFSPAEFVRVENVWLNTDRLLVDLQSHALFKDCRRWCDLEPHHFGFLITKNLVYVGQLSADEQTNEKKMEIRSLHFLLMALIRCIEVRTRSLVEILYANRIAELEVAYSYAATINMGIDVPIERPDLSVVVDNTKEPL